ncbi:GerAB/ArcD/ProY family transporter [Caldibacillus lycopersici]|uniref:GerAB/ArcD/ProY family transporter n=1 Tax=Perspicuibacillus lycopersici TaxID=1325689 RepID=A0AAE3ISH3_9BACI|nr:GerAB/ArcD/ProY family transporter [Perspicuibacillus lycopersici]MCU9612591.1 GerAB/ArcD/ProY family transporter [Perspicuibacillus lycopersici]
MLNILIIMGSLAEFDIRELLPTFQSGLFSTIWASRFHNTDWALAVMMASIILPLVKDKSSWKKLGLTGIAFAGLFVVIWPILEVGVLSAEVTAKYNLSCMQLARSAHIGLFFHRYEMIMVAFFALSNLTQIMMSLLCASVSLQKLIGLKDYRPTIIPVGLILGGFSYWIVFDHRRAIEFVETPWVIYAMATAIGLPLIILLLGTILKKKLRKKTTTDTSAKSSS